VPCRNPPPPPPLLQGLAGALLLPPLVAGPPPPRGAASLSGWARLLRLLPAGEQMPKSSSSSDPLDSGQLLL
jgi:hypothetical protein